MPKKILLVEDQAILAMTESRMIEKYGYSVVTVMSGEDAVSIAEKDPEIDLILMDINLGPGMDGTAAARSILQKRAIPIVFLSSYTDPGVVKKTESITAYGYVVKNTGETVLMNAIKMAYRLYNSITDTRESESRFRSMVENSPDPMFIHIDFKFVYLNPASLEFFGTSSAEKLLGTSILDRIDPASHGSAIHRINTMQRTLKAFSNRIEQKYIRLDDRRVWVEVSGIPIQYEGKPGILTTMQDINERKIREQEIQESRENLRITLNSIGDAVISTDIDGKIVRINPVAEKLTGWGITEAKGKDLSEVFQIRDADTGAKIRNPVSTVLESGRTVDLKNRIVLVSRDGSEHRIADSASPIQDNSGAISGVVLVFRDISEEHRRNRELREKGEFTTAVLSSIQDGVSVLDTDLTITYINPVTENRHKDNMPLIGKRCFAAFHNTDAKCKNCPSVRCMQSGKTEMSVVPVQEGPEKPVKWTEVYSYPFRDRETGKIRGVIEFVRDITERKNAEEELRNALKEKELLMKEMNHRIKNNLTIIASLVQLEASRQGGNVDFSDIISRIDAIRIIHEKLYQAEEITRIQLGDYIQDLLDTIFSSFSDKPITIRNTIKNISIPTKPAVSIGLIVNEIAVNAIKHGFNSSTKAVFSVSMDRKAENEYALVLSNSGRPFPEEVDIKNPASLGLQLVVTLVDQLKGSLELQKSPYPVYTLNLDLTD